MVALLDRHRFMIFPRFTLSILPNNLCTAFSVLALVTLVPATKAQDAVARGTTTAPLTHRIDAPAGANPPPLELSPVSNENVHTVSAPEGAEVSSEPRRFQYGFRVTVRGVY